MLGFLLGSRLLGEVFLKALPSFLTHPCPSGADGQHPGPELSHRKGHSSHFFLPLPEIGFRREVSKQLAKREEYSLPLLGSDQARELEGGEERALVSHPRLNMGWHLQACVGRKQAGTLPSGRAQRSDPDDGELPPRGLTLSSEYLTTASFLHRLLVTCHFSSMLSFFLFISIYITVYTTLYLKGMLCAKTCVVWGVWCP